ncbi:MAG: phosphopyruvate hydratase [Candidatus Nealsonbacteria bacterium]|nr:phosphopyruvate hydratase [Candidatus Nealsonbacteria bacterium]
MNIYKDSKVKSIKAREILDSRGNWTVEAELETPQGVFIDSTPSGASTGKYEAKTVAPEIAVKNINEIIAPELKGKDVSDQKEVDKIIKKLNVGANATTAVSMAICRAGAAAKNLPLYRYIAEFCGEQFSAAAENCSPQTCFNIINGGAHATNDLDFQEFMIVPQTKTIKESLKIASDIYRELRNKLGKNVGDEGGFAPDIKTAGESLELLSSQNIKIIIDVAASQFSDAKKKIYNLDYFENLIKKYSIIGLEDPFEENDWRNFQEITEKLGREITIIGDDLLATNPERIKEAHEKKACNGLLLKVNQIGTVSEAIEAAKLAGSYGWKIMVSHRSGETNDDFIADLAVGIGADYIKAGAPARGERVAKYNRLLRIEEELIG